MTAGSTPPTSRDSLAELEDLAERELRQGAIAYNPPEKMRLEETALVEVRVTRRQSPEFGTDLQGKGPTRIEELPVGTTMRSELKSSDFHITERRPAVQRLWKEGDRSWLWDIKPKRTGDLTLSLVVSVLYRGERLEYTALDRSIRVEVTTSEATKSWMARNGGNALGAAASLVPLITAGVSLLAWLRRREKPAPRP